MDEWIAKAVGKMHINKITQSDIAKKLNVTREYINMILTGKKFPANAEERIATAIDDIIADRQSN